MTILKTKPFNINTSKHMEKMRNDMLGRQPTKSLNSLIPLPLFEEFKIAAIRNRVSMTEVLINMMTEYVEENKII